MRRQPDFKAGQKIGSDYFLVRPLGVGQDGEVWLATKKSIEKTFAIKFLNGLESDEKLRRFSREIQILARINHPYVVTIVDKDEGWNSATERMVPCYVMEYLDAVSLDRAFGDMPREELLPGFLLLLRQVASALVSIHAEGITHGDMKSSNILVVRGTHIAKIADFGFGLLPGSTGDRTEYPGSSYHAPAGLSREAADVYRLGRTFQDCLQSEAGRLPPAHAEFLRKSLQRVVENPSTEGLSDIVENTRGSTDTVSGEGASGVDATSRTGISMALKVLTAELSAYIRTVRRRRPQTQLGHEALEGFARWFAKLEGDSSSDDGSLEEVRTDFRDLWNQLSALSYTEDLTSNSVARKSAALLWLSENSDAEHAPALEEFIARAESGDLLELAIIALDRARRDQDQ